MKQSKVTTGSALRELHHILSSALRTDGVGAFNGVTMTGAWYATDYEDAERMLTELFECIEFQDTLSDIETDVACLLDDLDGITEGDLFAVQNKLTRLSGGAA